MKGLEKFYPYDPQEVAHNRAALAVPGMRARITEIQERLMKTLTGRAVLSAEDKKALDAIERHLCGVAGIAEHPELVGYLAPLFTGERIRQGARGAYRVAYQSGGWRSVKVTGADGQQKQLKVPKRLCLCFAGRGRVRTPLVSEGKRVEILLTLGSSFAVRANPVPEMKKSSGGVFRQLTLDFGG